MVGRGTELELAQTVVEYPPVEHCALLSSDDDVRTLSDEDVHTLLVERLAASEERSTI